MKFSESWLRTFVNPSLASDELGHLLTMAGLEVEELDPVAPPFTNVVVAQVLEVVKHPDADRLNVCQVDIGSGTPVQIVCGAPNVAAGLKVPCAQPGAVLPGDFTIKVAKVRGIESSGMLCSAKELGTAEESSGLLILPADAPVGASIRDYLGLDDQLFTLKLTPNRADCLSLTGIAREVGALTSTPVTYPAIEPVAPTIDTVRRIVLDAPQACPRYCGRVISGVNAAAATPDWMKQRLERSGIRSISAVVDVTNYVLLELGQPLHAFDNDKLHGSIHARMPQPGEQILLLNEQKLTVADDVLLIADEQQPLAMAGIMGGEESGVTLATTSLFLESAFFAPAAIAGRARRYGFSSDASHRFERGVDFAGARQALERATRLVLDICGGQAGPVVEEVAELPQRQPVRLRTARAAKVIGVALTAERIAELFKLLDLQFVREGDDFVVTPPSFRFDIEIEEDLIEEIVRLHGYDNVPNRAPQGRLGMMPETEDKRSLQAMRQILADRGYQEVINYAFVDAAWEADFAPEAQPIKLANPIASQMGVMRSTLISGLVSTLAYNLKRKQSRVRVFETGRCFLRDDQGTPVAGFRQPWRLGGLAWGGAVPEQWGSPARHVDFYDLKGDLEALLLPFTARFEKTAHAALHPGRAARIILNDQEIGVIGELHPEWVQKYDLVLAPVVFEVDLDALRAARLPAYVEVSKFPPVVRDLAVLVDQKVTLQAMLSALDASRPPLVQEIQLFDVYTGKGVEPGQKSLAFRIVMQDTQKTLQDADVENAMSRVLETLEKNFAARRRV
jgi:phenylalanyl-tRNA synthetase beta chain